jgi:hypothetical protein
MPLTLNQFLLLVLTFVAVALAIYIIRFLVQLRRMAVEAEKTMVEARRLIVNLNELQKTIKDRTEDLGDIMEASKETVVHLSEATFILTTRILKPTSRYWPLIYPLLRFLWRRRKKGKEKKNGR